MAKNAKTKKNTSTSNLENIKMEAAREVGVTLKKNGNADMTAKDAGSVGGQMVKKMVDSYKKSNNSDC